MKKTIITLIIIILIILGLFISYKYIYSEKNTNNDNEVKMNNIKPDKTTEKNEYIDNNPIKIGLYKYYGRSKDRELINEYTSKWSYHNDISSFEVFYSNDNFITGNSFQDTFKEYIEKYNNIDNYKIGYHISFITTNGEINKTILSPKDTEDFFNYLEIYLYDDYHREKGVWYSHTTEEEMSEETLLTSIKLTAGKNISEITSDITVTAFTYDYDDFDDSGNYKGISKHTIVVNKNL